MQSDEWEEFAILLQMEEWNKTTDRDTNSPDTPDLQAVAADLRGLLLLDQRSSEIPKQHSEKLPTEQQLRQDEELEWRMEHGSLAENQSYDLFFAEWTDDRGYVGVGCVIKDAEGQVVFEHRECIGLDISHYYAEYIALINGLDVARSIGLRQINAYGNRPFIYWEVINCPSYLVTSELLQASLILVLCMFNL